MLAIAIATSVLYSLKDFFFKISIRRKNSLWVKVTKIIECETQCERKKNIASIDDPKKFMCFVRNTFRLLKPEKISFFSVFREFFVGINKIFNLAAGLGTSLSFYGV